MSQFITEENARLHAEMLEKGHAFHKGEQYEHFINSDKEYQSYPVGYIRGPHRTPHGYLTVQSVSVQGTEGWHQRTFVDRQEAIDWAIAKQKEILNE